jgi:hypothetical protein
MLRFAIIASMLLFASACVQKHLETTNLNDPNEYILDSLLEMSSEAQLIAKYGKGNVVRDTAYYPEGAGEYFVSVLFPNTADSRLEITWNDSITFSSLNAIMISNDSSRWKTSEGITVGTTLKELIEINKKDVKFSGLGWDYGGYVNWDGGALQHRGLSIVLDAPAELNEGIQLDSIYGDQTISSNARLLAKMTLVVSQLTLFKEHE